MDREQAEQSDSSEISGWLDRLADGDLEARDRIIEIASGRLRVLASRMLSRFPQVRRWDDTDDVFQNAVMRLHRALAEVHPDSPRAIMALAATQLHRELIDLARRYRGPMSFEANHATQVPGASDISEPPPFSVERAPAADESLDRWSMFHDVIAGLPTDQREVFHLVWYLNADQKTIARLLECSERTVKSRWREAREAVRKALDGEPPQ
jgi:RNA polymerase sigma factor (sigma-70 family)